MKAHAAANDQYTLIAESSQCPACLQVSIGVEIAAQRQLNYRDIRSGKYQFQRNEHAVVETALTVHSSIHPILAELLGDLLCQRRVAGRRVTQLIGVWRKAIVVKDQLGTTVSGDASVNGCARDVVIDADFRATWTVQSAFQAAGIRPGILTLSEINRTVQSLQKSSAIISDDMPAYR